MNAYNSTKIKYGILTKRLPTSGFRLPREEKRQVRMIAFCLAKDGNELKGDGLRAAAHLFPKFSRAIKSLQD